MLLVDVKHSFHLRMTIIGVSICNYKKLNHDNCLCRLEMDQAMANKQSIEMVHSKDLMALRMEDQTSKQLVTNLTLKVFQKFLLLLKTKFKI